MIKRNILYAALCIMFLSFSGFGVMSHEHGKPVSHESDAASGHVHEGGSGHTHDREDAENHGHEVDAETGHSHVQGDVESRSNGTGVEADHSHSKVQEAAHSHSQGTEGEADHSHSQGTEGEAAHSHSQGGMADHGHPYGSGETIQLESALLRKFNIEVEPVGTGRVRDRLQVPCDITFNKNRFAHVVPAVSGVVRTVVKELGDTVAAGETMAWIESRGLGRAKVDYLARWSDSLCGKVKLARIREVHDNTRTLLSLLAESPSVESLHKLNKTGMGKNSSLLISAYVSFMYEKERYIREKDLLGKKITSREAFLQAERAYKKAEAEYLAQTDSISYDIGHELQDADHSQQVREIGLMEAERKLYVLGLSERDITSLQRFASMQVFNLNHLHSDEYGHESDNGAGDRRDHESMHEAADVLPSGHAGFESASHPVDEKKAYEQLSWYPVRAPFDGTVVKKHIASGEIFQEYKGMYSVADLRTVWAELYIHQRHSARVRKGWNVLITTESGVKASGTVSYVDVTVDSESRTVTARVVLQNTDGRFKPGQYATAVLMSSDETETIVVPKGAVQYIDDNPCVFVQTEEGFKACFVTTGGSDGDVMEITGGLVPGDVIVTKHAFRLKAELKKRLTGDAGGGHGHAH